MKNETVSKILSALDGRCSKSRFVSNVIEIYPKERTHTFDDEIRKEIDEDVKEFIETSIKKGGIAFDFYQNMKDAKLEIDEDGYYCFNAYRYKPDDDDIKRVSVMAASVFEVLQKLSNKYSDDYIAEIYADGDQRRLNDFLKDVNEIIQEYSETVDFSPVDYEFLRNATFGVFVHQRKDPYALDKYGYKGWIEYYFDRLEPKSRRYENLDLEGIWIVSCNACKLDTRMNRLLKLMKIGAPSVLIRNEMCMIVKSLYFFMISPVGCTDYFDEHYGLAKR